MASDTKKRPLLELSNLWCTFCGRQKFIWDAYALRCSNCDSGITWYDDNGEKDEFRYFYPSTELFESDFKSGVRYSPDNAGGDHVYQYNPEPQYDILTGHKLPDRRQIEDLEKEIEVHDKTVHRLRARITTLLGER